MPIMNLTKEKLVSLWRMRKTIFNNPTIVKFVTALTLSRKHLRILCLMRSSIKTA